MFPNVLNVKKKITFTFHLLELLKDVLKIMLPKEVLQIKEGHRILNHSNLYGSQV